MAILDLGRVDGFDPIITVEEDTADCYKLHIETADDEFSTPNLKGFAPVITIEEDTSDNYRLRIETANDEFLTPNLKGKDAPVVIDEYHFLGHELDPFECAELRYLPLKYHLIEIIDYQELCDRKYCGDENNNTADWWYKCDHLGNRTVTGLWMRVEDPSGLFMRIAGQNAVFTAANGTPYDGNTVGTFNPDTTRIPSLRFSLYASGAGELQNPYTDPNSEQYIAYGRSATSTMNMRGFHLPNTVSNFIETAGAWLAVNIYITY